MDNNSVIIPFCLYKNDNNQFRLSSSKKTTNGNFICLDVLEPDWKLESTFYAINPMLRPIPVGMNLFIAENNTEAPYETKKISIIYNTLDVEKNGVYFIAYSTRTINTVPLFFDNIEGKFYISFQEPKITIEQNPALYTQNLSPIFVLKKELFPEGEFKFICNNGSCIPNYIDKDIFNPNKKSKPMSLQKCSIDCSVLTSLEEGGGKPRELSDILKSYDVKKRNFSRKFKRAFKKVPSWIFLILFLLLVVFLCLTLYLIFY